jgi:adenylate cyclase class IV
MHNVEFKAELRDPELARAALRALRAAYILSFGQVDTYYRVASGRLKRRETEGEPAEYIFYERADRTAPKLSKFTIYSESQARERFGEAALPVWLVVRKRRELWMLGSVRVHLDEVEGLGAFIEFEALVSTDQTIAKGHERIGELRRAMGPALGESIACGYSDLIDRDQASKAESRPGG